MARTFAWKRSMYGDVDHAADRYGTAACGIRPAISDRAPIGKPCKACTDELEHRAAGIIDAARGTRIIGVEYREYLAAMLFAAPSGGLRESATTTQLRAWLTRHGLATRRVTMANSRTTAWWNLTKLGREALDRGRY